MAIACDANSLSAQATCYDCGIPPGLQQAIIIYLLCFIANNPSSGGGGGESAFVSAPTAAVGGQFSYVFPHLLPSTPKFTRLVLRCVVNDAASGAVVGDELDCAYIIDSFSGTTNPAFGIYANATTITVSFSEDYGNLSWMNFLLVGKGGNTAPTSGITNITNFRMVVYAET